MKKEKQNIEEATTKALSKTNVIGRFFSLKECENEAISFTKDKMKVVGGLLSEDYKIGYKEGIEHYLAEKGIVCITEEEYDNLEVIDKTKAIP